MPSITIWDRLEPRCRENDPTPGLEARVHDPLWLLARQWQFGEFEGRDAGSPIASSISSSIAPLNRFVVAGQAAQPYDGIQPMEAIIQAEPARPGTGAIDLRQAAEAGLYLLRLLAAAQMPSAVAQAYRAHYPLLIHGSPASDVASIAPALAGRGLDGVKLYSDLKAAGASLPAAPAVAAAQQAAVLQITRTWLQWYDNLFVTPAGPTAWSPERMEYDFSIAAAGASDSYVAQEYDGDSVDWHVFDRSTASLAGGSGQPKAVQQNLIASPVTFRGMPARRYWEMEDGGINIGLLSAGAEDLGRLLLREFALIYGNDWFQFALMAPVGSEFTVTELSVADTFGITTPIPHYSAEDGAAGAWHMFSVSADPLATSAETTLVSPPSILLLLPGTLAQLSSAPLEQVLMLRDELAETVWGVEQTVQGASGLPLDRTLDWRINIPPVPPPSGDLVLRYQLGSSVPDYWIPFLPVQIDTAGHLQLRRARLPGPATEPQGRFLTETTSLFLEEVPQEGVRLIRLYRSARGPDGSAYLWVGRQRTAGSGEGRSGLRFDYLE
jgi:hypothetical protein